MLYKPFRKKGENLWDLGLGKEFLDWMTKIQFTVGKTDKLDFTGIKSFCSVKNHVGRRRGWAIDWERIFSDNVSDKGLVIARVCKELQGSRVKKTIQLQNKQKA